MSATLSFFMGAFLGMAIGVVAVLDAVLLYTLHEMRKGKQK